MKRRFKKYRANRCGYHYQSHSGGQYGHRVQRNAAPTIVASIAVSTGQTAFLTTAEIHSGYQGSKQSILITVVTAAETDSGPLTHAKLW